jgi:beta-phosphoglucomutase-like phosphatase (HAD superfamily)
MMRTRRTGRCALCDGASTIFGVIFGVEAVVDVTWAAAAAWKAVFDPFLRTHAAVYETAFVPFDVPGDYLRYLHGRPRIEGVRHFLASRDIILPFDDVRGLAMSQEDFFLGEIRAHGLRPVPAAIALVRELGRRGVRTAAVSLHRDGAEVLRMSGAAGPFDLVMDCLDAPGFRLSEHPDAHLYLLAAQRLRTPPGRAAVIEESAPGVAAAREGGFAAVVGVDRTGESAALREHGATLVLADLSELRPRFPGVV